MIEKLLNKLRNVVTRGVVESRDDAGTYTVSWAGERTSAGMEILETQGVHFRAPTDADGVTLAPFGDRSAAVMVAAQGVVPTDAIDAGEGGLHYLGEWRVFVDADGTVRLSARDPSDFVALASLVDDRLAKIDQDLSTLKTAIGAGFTAVGVGAAANGPAGKTAFDSASAAVPTSLASVASTKVKAE